jgi:hypothetical protein
MTKLRRAVRALEADPERAYTEIAREIHATPKTVRTAARSLGLPPRIEAWEDCGHHMAHLKWHVQRGLPNPECPLCREEDPLLPPP